MDARKPSPSAGERLKALRESLGLTHRDVAGEEPGDCRGKTQPGVSHFPCLGNGHRKRKIHSQHLQAPNAQRYLQSKIHGTDFHIMECRLAS